MDTGNGEEITRFVKERKLNAEDRPDIIWRIYKMKLDNLMDDLTKNHIFGKTKSVEFQKRGLPHAHIILWVDPRYKFPTADHVDKIIFAEIQDKEKDQELYQAVSECMIHGPCRLVTPNSPCMENGKCSKYYPKNHVENSSLDNEGYPIYRHRDTGRFIEKNKYQCDNRYVVPYNDVLLRKYRAHINVEWCNQSVSVKYLFKYVNKGLDRVIVSVEPHRKEVVSEQNNVGETNNDPQERNQVHDYFDCRYVSACEAMWRIRGYPIDYRQTSVTKLTFHEKGKQPFYVKECETAESVLYRVNNDETQFTAWFELNKRDPEAAKLLYEQIPNFYTWNGKDKDFRRRKMPGFAAGRINHVSPKIDDAYHLRILINNIRGPKGFDDIKTVEGVVHKTYRDACYALGLLDDDKKYIHGIEEANVWCSPKYVRKLFVIMLISESLSSPAVVWEHTWKILSEDFQRKVRDKLKRPS